jgi:hypothetical protein
MPYIVTTKRQCQCDGSTHIGSVSRVATVTLDEAAYLYRTNADRTAWDAIRTMGDCGGKVGPLPDGTVIEVEQVAVGTLAIRAGLGDMSYSMRLSEYIDAYNARQEGQ